MKQNRILKDIRATMVWFSETCQRFLFFKRRTPKVCPFCLIPKLKNNVSKSFFQW